MLAKDRLLDIKDSVGRISGVLCFCSISDKTLIGGKRDVRWRYPVAHIVCKNLEVNLIAWKMKIPLHVRP
jgi:hypothetical protein